MSKIYLDMDGVLADFDRGLLENYGVKNCIKNYGTDWKDKTEEQKKVAEDVRKIMTLPDFWRHLPIMKGAHELWNSIANPFVLTALPGQGHDRMITIEKKEWIKKVFESKAKSRVVTCLRPEKVKYAEGNLLVDDLEKNCIEWEAAGGRAILFENSKQAIRELNKVKHLHAA